MLLVDEPEGFPGFVDANSTEDPFPPAAWQTLQEQLVPIAIVTAPTPATQRPCFDTIEGRRTCVSDTLCAKIRVPDTKNTVSDTFCAKNSV